MFTGLIEDTGTIRAVDDAGGSLHVTVSCSLPTSELELGESIAVQGACFTVVAIGTDSFSFDATLESLARTTLGQAKPGTRVHLERAARLGSRLGGHIVLGHVDDVGTLQRRREIGNGILLSISAPPHVTRLVVPKGSIAVDGASLTVNDVQDGCFDVMIVPFTAEKTLLSHLQPGSQVNLEADILGKYVLHLLPGHTESNGIDVDFLREHGFV